MGNLLKQASDIISLLAPEYTVPGDMQVLKKKIYRGPHLHSATPMIAIQLDLGQIEHWPTNKITGFEEKLLTLLPGLENHGCSYGHHGGLVKRIQEGTWLGHVMEHVALELQTLCGLSVSRGKTRSEPQRPGVYNIMYEYEFEAVGLWAGRYALEIVHSLLPENLSGLKDIDRIVGGAKPCFTTLPEAVAMLKNILRGEQYGPTTRSIIEAAKKRGIPVTRLDDCSFVQLGWGKYQRRICGSMTDLTSQIAVDAACDKALAKSLLNAVQIPTPLGNVVLDAEGAVRVAQEIGYPVAVKPLDGNHGRGVTTNIMSDEHVVQAFAEAAQHNGRVIVEQHYTGRDYRILLVDYKVVAVAERIPAQVTGDGEHNISQLVARLNDDPNRGHGHENILSKVKLNQGVIDTLARAGLLLESVPQAGEVVRLCCAANLSTGGTAIDRTDDIHPDNVVLMERAARAIGLNIAGIDLVTPDIAKPFETNSGGVIEINASPGFRMHLRPAVGEPRAVGEAVISMLYPKDAPSRIPVIAITGTNGKSTTTRMVAHILRQHGRRVGFTTTSGVYINDDILQEGDCSGPQSAKLLLRDTTIDVAVLETARGGILREGLAVDRCDVGAVLNVTADHLGLDGVDSLEDLAAVKSVVVEAVSRKGVSVLNADDPLVRDMAKIAGGRICYFSMQGGHGMSQALHQHIRKGGMAVVCENWAGLEEIVIHSADQHIPLIEVKKIPATHGGVATFNTQNALAAAAMAWGMGVDIETLRSALTSFGTTYEENPGRFNVHDDHGFRVIMDYAHNPAALNLLAETVETMRGNYRTVIGMIGTPGDRRDEDLREMGRIGASMCDVLVFREGDDLRGRAPGSLNALQSMGALGAGFFTENLHCVDTEEDAIDLCLRLAQPGDLVILSPSDVAGTWQRILEHKPQSAVVQTRPSHRTQLYVT